MKLHCKIYGQGESLVILHGLFGSLDNWHSLSLKLGEHFHVLAIDQRNHGHSPHSGEMSYTLMSEDIGELLHRYAIRRTRVLGHSMGGKTAMQFALLFPEQVERLVVVDIAPRTYPPHHQKILAALLALELSRFETRKQLEEALAMPIPDLALRQFLLKNIERDPQGRMRWKIGLEEINRNYENLRHALPDTHRFLRPTLFLRGEFSDYLQQQDLAEVHRRFPAANLHTIPQSGHLPHVENPEALLSELRSFLLPLPA
jgi:esterase